ncbi:MAG: cysteine desulfurase NifS [Elusimicrobiota bacterium]
MKRIYMDNNATTRVREEVVNTMIPYYAEHYGNPSSIHYFGQKSRAVIDDARIVMARFISADDPQNIVFTSGGTESDNFAIKGFAMANSKRGKHIITSSIEHHAVFNTCEYLRKNFGYSVTYIPVDRNGVVDIKKLETALSEDTILVSIMHANNETGVIQPIKSIGKMLKNKNIAFHTDAVQTAGKVRIDVDDLGVDLLSISAHKFYGPKGVGMLYIRKGLTIDALLHGGHHESNYRAGTENVPCIAGMSAAAQIAMREYTLECSRISLLREKFETGILERIPQSEINGIHAERLYNTSSIAFKYVEGEALLLAMDNESTGIAASSGSACTAGSSEPSHVLTAMGVEPLIAQGTIRFSFGHDNTEEEVDYLLDTLPRVVEKLRTMSPLWRQ